MISAKIIKDSINPDDSRLVTWELTYPRYIHSEFMTHRVWSRNAASSRAIPVKKMLDNIKNNPALPIIWGKNKPGMQSSEFVKPNSPEELDLIIDNLKLRDKAIDYVNHLSTPEINIHKQWANRYTEPWMNITVIATSSYHYNFFKLRAHEAALPDFQVLAYLMLDRYMESKPTELNWGEWHIPYTDKLLDNFDEWANKHMTGTRIAEEVMDPVAAGKLAIATARCARVSYLTHDGIIDYDKDLELHDKLMESGHWSPFEHCAEALNKNYGCTSNFHKSWFQYRKLFNTENIEENSISLEEIRDKRPDWVTDKLKLIK